MYTQPYYIYVCIWCISIHLVISLYTITYNSTDMAKIRFTVLLEPDVLAALDKKRDLIPRSAYIERLVENDLKNGELITMV